MAAIIDAPIIGSMIREMLIPADFNVVISLSADNRPTPISMAIRSDIGTVISKKGGMRYNTSREMSITPTPLLIIRSINCRILPMSKTNVRINRLIMNGKHISLKMYLSMILTI